MTVPKAIRRALGVHSGDSLVFGVKEGGVRARGWSPPTSFADDAGAWREDGGMSLQEINAYIRDLRGHDDGRGDGRGDRTMGRPERSERAPGFWA